MDVSSCNEPFIGLTKASALFSKKGIANPLYAHLHTRKPMVAYSSVLLQTAPNTGHFCLTFPDKK